jgi:2-iminoacetate synthase ThiH
VLLHGAIKNIQVSWVKLGFQLSLDCLNAGANDFSGTLMEESISKAAGANFGEFVEPAEFRRMIRSIGRTPAERTTSYKIRRAFDATAESELTASNSPSPFPLLNADPQQTHHITHGESAY